MNKSIKIVNHLKNYWQNIEILLFFCHIALPQASLCFLWVASAQNPIKTSKCHQSADVAHRAELHGTGIWTYMFAFEKVKQGSQKFPYNLKLNLTQEITINNHINRHTMYFYTGKTKLIHQTFGIRWKMLDKVKQTIN